MEERFEDNVQRAAEPRRGGLPRASIKKAWPLSPVWIVPLLAAGFIGWLLYRTYIPAGHKITILFQQGKGIESGKTLVQYRGVRIGEVTGIGLSQDQHAVEVQARLDRSAVGLARADSRFWIVHPEVSLSGIRGLTTIVSGNYIQVAPGQGPGTNRFIGLEEPPISQAAAQDALSVVLLTGQLKSIKPGTPILYHGFQVGETTRNELASDAQVIRIFARIYPRYVNLVRKDSRFWNAGGIDVNLGLFGADITAQSIKTLVVGAIAFATPDSPEEPAPNETSFRLFDKAQDQWLNWAPAIKLAPLPTSDASNSLSE